MLSQHMRTYHFREPIVTTENSIKCFACRRKFNLNSHKFGPNTIENLFNSQILTSNQANELIRLCEFKSDVSLNLIYRGTEDYFDSKDFHSCCKGMAPTLIVVKAKRSGFIFGGNIEVNWRSASKFKFD